MSCGCERSGDHGTGRISALVARCAFHKKVRNARILLPGILLMLIPKCPICLAAWIAFGTGIGISFTVAAWLRWGLIAIGIISLCYLIFKSTVQLWKNSCSSSGKT